MQGDALAWMDKTVAEPGTSVLTSLPDVSEIEELDLAGWRSWFVTTASTVLRWVPEDGVSIFYQSDIRREGALVDKGYLVMRAAEDVGATVIFHKIVCREPPGSVGFGRPTFSHLIAMTRGQPRPPRRPTPDVLPSAGPMSWSKATGAWACLLACRYLRDDTETRLVVDPFCGRGTVLGVANLVGLPAVGVERNGRRCRAARAYSAPPMTDFPEGLQ